MAQGKSLTTKDYTDIANFYIQGLTYQQIGEALGFNKKTIYLAIKHNEECKAIIEDMRDRYAEELKDLAVDTLKEVLLSSDELPKTILIQYLQTALKYSGMETNQNINVKKESKLSVNEISWDELKKLQFK